MDSFDVVKRIVLVLTLGIVIINVIIIVVIIIIMAGMRVVLERISCSRIIC